jgi:Calcineurin-like phosphoesterase
MLDRIEAIIAAERADRIVFLGDYFDQFYDTPPDAEEMAKWLVKRLTDPRRIHLIGNHDASYLWPVDSTYCPGFTWEKATVIHKILGENAKDKFVFHTWIDGWLLTHAGLSADWVTVPTDLLPKWIEKEEKAARQAFDQGTDHWFVETGFKRGGFHPSGGILWCDHDELRPISGVRQIYGHTPGSQPRWRGSDHLCLDTADERGPQHFAFVEDGAVTVRKLHF